MGARCSVCGGSVMPYRSYLLYSRPEAVCPSCGTRVRLEGWGGLVVAGVVLLAGLLLAVLFVHSIRVFALVTVGLILLALILDYGGYRLLRWLPTAPPPAHGAG